MKDKHGVEINAGNKVEIELNLDCGVWKGYVSANTCGLYIMYKGKQEYLKGILEDSINICDKHLKPTKPVTPNKYDRTIYTKDGKVGIVDVYRVLDAFNSGCPILDHISKKSLCAGLRGHKGRMEDLIDIRKSINEAIDLEKQKQEK